MARNRRRRQVAGAPRRWHRKVRALLLARWLRAAAAAVCGLALAAALVRATPPAWQLIKTHPYFAIAQVELSGNRRLSREEVLQWAEVADGDSVWDAPPVQVRARLLQHPWIEGVSAIREFPRRLVVRVRERTPVAIAALDGRLHYVDRGGHVLGALSDEDSRDFPIITGLDIADTKAFSQIALHRSLQLLRWCERLRCFDEISEIRVDLTRGITVYPMLTPVPVVLGWGNWREKLARSARVFAAWQGQVGRVAQVDVSFRGVALVKLHDEPAPAKRPPKRGMRI
jgi:cell division protein FtsQ